MTRGRSLLALLALLMLLASGCRRDKHLAEVKKHQGDLTRDTASSLQKWQPAADGAKLSIGDGLKTGASSDAVVRLVGGGTIALSSDTTVRFVTSASGAGAPKLSVETGEASIEADDRALAVQTTFGLAQIEAGGKLRVSAAEGGLTRVEVTVGSARFETEDGGVALAPGKALEVSVGGAIVERDAVDASADAASRSPRAADVAEASDAGGGSLVTLDVRGTGVRVQSRGASAWQPIGAGAGTASPGDTIDVPNGASVDLRRGARRGRLVGAGRYVVGDAGGGALVQASGGRVELDATTEDVSVQVPGGVIVAKSGGAGKSRVDAEIAATGTKVNVRQGQGEVRGAGTPETVRAGESATLSTKGAVAVAGRGPERADFSVRAGDSFTIRDPRPPTAVGLDYSAACPAAAVVSRRDGATVRGDSGKAAMSFPAGQHEYTVRCIGPDGVEAQPAVTGNITVVADAARAEFARLPPSTMVDTDGRRYTVHYQNLLPAVVARWPDAPPSGGYVLHVDKDRSKSATAKQSLRPGSVGEGTHVLWFETADGSKKSGETTLVIKFDNAAPTASVREPADGSFQPGEAVKVSGIVVEGWTVSVNGQAVGLDDQKRFSTTGTTQAGEGAIVLRLSNPKRGTVYYVRHAAGAR